MEHDDMRQGGGDNLEPAPLWKTRSGLVLCGFLLIAAFYLLTEHTAHVFGALPYLLLAACPLMHLFMHHGHGGHGSEHSSEPPGSDRGQGGGT
jgi:hypothetical protein